MVLSASSMPQKKLPWNVNIEEYPPGTQSSNAHAHSHEDELVFILSGKGRYWYQGEQPEKILKKGDCIGWKAGTGLSHTILNDGEGPNGEGKRMIALHQMHFSVMNTIIDWFHRRTACDARMGRL